MNRAAISLTITVYGSTYLSIVLGL